MSTRHSRQNIGWAEEGTENTSPLADVSSTKYFYFGPIVATPGMLPSYEKIWIAYHNGGAIEPSELVVVDKKVTETLSFVMTNGLMDYYLYGDVTNTGAADPEQLHTISFHDFPLTFTVRWETGYGTAATVIKREVTGSKIQSRVINWDFTTPGNPVTMGINIEGRGYGVALDNAQIADPVHAKSQTSTLDNAFFLGKSSNEVIEWDSTTKGSAIDWSNILLKCILTSARFHKRTKYAPNTTTSEIHMGKVAHSVEFVVLRDTVAAHTTDFLADFEADNTSGGDDLQIKLYSDATRYMDIDMQGVSLSQVKPNYARIEDNEVPTWECVGTVKNVVPAYLDGCLNAKYTDQ